MRRDSAGTITSAKSISEINGGICFCSVCNQAYTPSLERDCFLVKEEKDSDGEMPIICERCFDEDLISQGKRIIDLTQPILGLSFRTWIALAGVGVIALLVFVC